MFYNVLPALRCLIPKVKLKNMTKNAQQQNSNPSAGSAKLPVMPRLFAITTSEGWNEMFWDKDKAQQKINNEYKKDFLNEEFWVEEVRVS
jgi:hypothetical protein